MPGNWPIDSIPNVDPAVRKSIPNNSAELPIQRPSFRLSKTLSDPIAVVFVIFDKRRPERSRQQVCYVYSFAPEWLRTLNSAGPNRKF
jgi:hypothetical protein